MCGCCCSPRRIDTMWIVKQEERNWAVKFMYFFVQGSIHMNMPWYSQWSALRASLASSHKVSIREGFEWTEVEPPVGCVLKRRRDGGRRAGFLWLTGRQTNRQEEAEEKRDKETGQQGCEHIYRFTCTRMNLSLFLKQGLTLCFILSMTDWCDSFIGCRRHRTNGLWKIKIS